MAGVCAGVAQYLGIDPVILRVLVVVLALFGGSGLVLYAAGWLLIPDEGATVSEGQRFIDRHGMAVAIVVAVLAGIVLLGIGDGWWLGGPDPWPLLVVGGIGVVVWMLARDRSGAPRLPSSSLPGSPPGPVPDSPTSDSPTSEAPMPAAPTSWTTSSSTTSPADPYATTYPTSAYPYGAEAAQPPLPPAPARPRSVLGLLTVSVAAIVTGVLVAFDRAGWWDVDPVVVLAVLTGIVGLGLVVGAVVGRSRGLIALGILLALVTAGTASAPSSVSGHAGDIVWAPSTVSQVEPTYEWGAGSVVLDLSAVSLEGRHRVSVDLGVGNLTVVLPPDVEADVSASVGAGSITIPQDGIAESGLGRDVQTTLPSVDETPAAGAYVLDLSVGLGELEVRRAAS